MTTRKRIISQSSAVFTSNITGSSDSNIGTSDVVNLKRVQDYSTAAEITDEDVFEHGRLSALQSVITEEPDVSSDLTYLLADGYNESGIGFTLFNEVGQEVNCISGILGNQPQAQKNYYSIIVQEGFDAHGINPQSTSSSGQVAIVGIGNAFLTNYNVNLAVGDLASASVSTEASNIQFSYADPEGIRNPAIITTGTLATQYTGKVLLPASSTGTLSVAAIRHGDIEVDFGSASLDMGGAILDGMTEANTRQASHVQSVTIDLPLSRSPQNKLGRQFAFSRELDVPIDVTLSVSANMADIATGSMVDLICGGRAERDIVINLYRPCGNGTASELSMQYKLKGATLDSQSDALSIGDNKTVDLTFSTTIGGPNDQTKGLFISGRYGS